MLELAEKYLWLNDNNDVSAWTVAVIADRTPPEVAGLYGANLDEPLGRLTFREAEELRYQQSPEYGDFLVAQIFTSDSRVIAIEPNGYVGNSRELACRAAENGGSFFAIYWCHANAGFALIQALDGVLTADFNPYDVSPDRPGAEWYETFPDWLDVSLAEEHGLDEATCMAFMEQQTGVAFDRAWLDQALLTYRIYHQA